MWDLKKVSDDFDPFNTLKVIKFSVLNNGSAFKTTIN